MSYKNRANFKPLSEFIKRVNIKNKDGKVSELKGINIDKFFMPSVANVVGTDLTRYKVVKPQQFACNRMHVGRDYRLPVAVSRFDNNIIVSPAYDVFEIIDTNELNPEYLMMWFSRSEFDRNCWFYTDTDVRGKLGWDSFCEIELPIPSIEKQNEIVKEYNIVINRIKLNEQLNQKLEETAQALYKYWFVDFEFPNAEGDPYKTSGGEMVYSEELDKEIPVGWSVENIGDVVESLGGGTPKTETVEFWKKGIINWFSPTDITNSNYIFCNNSNKKITQLGLNKSSAKLFPKNSLMMTSRATIGKLGVNTIEACTNQGFITLIPNKNYKLFSLVEWLKSNLDEVEQLASGSTFKEISKTDFRNIKILKTSFFDKLELKLIPIYEKINNISQQSQTLQELQSLLLARLTKVEIEII